MTGPSARQIIDHLKLERHPEGGWFRQTFRDTEGPEGRGHSTAILYLLETGDRSHWHRVDAVEIWHFHAGSPLDLRLSPDGKTVSTHRLGPDILQGESPQVIVPRGHWQSAGTTGNWTLVGCTVSPGFVFGGFKMAPPGWQPG